MKLNEREKKIEKLTIEEFSLITGTPISVLEDQLDEGKLVPSEITLDFEGVPVLFFTYELD